MKKISSRLPRHYTRLLALVFSSAVLAACQTQPPAAPTPLDKNSAERTAALSGLGVDPQASEIRLLVYRDGALARFGHNHVIIGRVRGNIRAGESAAASGFRLEIPVDSFEVDSPSARGEEGAEFSAEVSDAARKGTRENMLGAEVLDAARHSLIRIESVALSGPRWNPEVTARVDLRGVSKELKFPAAVFQQDGTLTVIAAFRINQSDFGMKPFTVLGGAIQVRDAMDIRIHLVARSAPD